MPGIKARNMFHVQRYKVGKCALLWWSAAEELRRPLAIIGYRTSPRAGPRGPCAPRRYLLMLLWLRPDTWDKAV